MMRTARWAAVPLLALLLAACAVRMVAPYDDETRDATLATAKQVDAFYVALMEVPGRRPYGAWVQRWVDIETELRSLLLRNQVRGMNAESVTISENLLELWVKYKERHKERDDYTDGNAKLDWKRLSRMFGYALTAEEAKQDPGADTDEGG